MKTFRLNLRGNTFSKSVTGTACHVRKSTPIMERLRSDLGLEEGRQTTDDMLFTLETVSCLGACGLAPVMMVNDEVHSTMTPDKATELINKIRGEENE